MKHLISLIAFAAAIGSAQAQSVTWTPDQTTIVELEAKLTMPVGGRTLSEYARYYEGQLRDGRHIVRAEFVLPLKINDPSDRLIELRRSPGVYVVSGAVKFPGIMDGGCNIVSFLYDVDAKRFENMRCNGVA